MKLQLEKEFPQSGLNTLAVIPARGGSKRIHNKNIREFRGKPILAWSIEAAKGCGLFEHILVSTDDPEIARIAKKYGADVPFIRPSEISDDYTPTRPVVNHAINEASRLWEKPCFTCCIYPTAPFIRVVDLKEGYKLLKESNINFAFTATRYHYPIQRAFKRSHRGIEMIYPEHLNTRSQDLEPAYHDAGQFYWGRTEAFLNNRPTISSLSEPILLPGYMVHDIDTEEDWLRAEVFHSAFFT